MRHSRLSVADSKKAIADVNSWGDYPEKLDDYELENCWFYAIRDNQGYIWFERFPYSPSDIVIHLAFNPEYRRKTFSMMLWAEILAEATHQKGKVLWALRPTELVKQYAERLGFAKDDTIHDWYRFDLVEL